MKMIAAAPQLIVWTLGGFLLACRCETVAAERIVSKYTSTAETKAIRFERDKDDPAGSFRGIFRGLGGYDLEHIGGDERSWLNIRHGGKTADLYAATMARGGGTFPHKANDTVEWRGVESDGRFKPYAIIYRLKFGNDETRRWRTRLIIIKLDKGYSTVVGHAEGANEDEKAKRIADGARSE